MLVRENNYCMAARVGLMCGLSLILIVYIGLLNGCGGSNVEDVVPEEGDGAATLCSNGFSCIENGFLQSIASCCESASVGGDNDDTGTIKRLRERLRRTKEALRLAEDAYGKCSLELEQCQERPGCGADKPKPRCDRGLKKGNKHCTGV